MKKIINTILLAGLAIGSISATEKDSHSNNPDNIQSSSKLAKAGKAVAWAARKTMCAGLVGLSASCIATYVTAPILIKSFKRQMLSAAFMGNFNALEYYLKDFSGENPIAITVDIFERFVPMLPAIAAATGTIGLAGLVF